MSELYVIQVKVVFSGLEFWEDILETRDRNEAFKSAETLRGDTNMDTTRVVVVQKQ